VDEKFVIFNADDFGASTGVNQGIARCHTHGVVTSTSLMVTGRAVREAVAMSCDLPKLAIGLHWDVWGEDEREFDIENIPAVRDEFQRQVAEFYKFLGRLPTHVDSHRHAHRNDKLAPVFRELVEPLGVSLRDNGPVTYIPGFYAQWEWKVTDLYHVSVLFLQYLLRTEVMPGFSELSCHPGYITSDYSAVYLSERESEIATLTDPRIRETIASEHISLISYADYNQLRRSAVEQQADPRGTSLSRKLTHHRLGANKLTP
jgi:chitin disaccharide deacetylase